ncbi:MAG: hypothetical protein IAE98_03150 [Candidatus Kapabacteria bacterium]|nr:hypothetical protein [Candidatus Kapabacteria bacterium]
MIIDFYYFHKYACVYDAFGHDSDDTVGIKQQDLKIGYCFCVGQYEQPLKSLSSP